MGQVLSILPDLASYATPVTAYFLFPVSSIAAIAWTQLTTPPQFPVALSSTDHDNHALLEWQTFSNTTYSWGFWQAIPLLVVSALSGALVRFNHLPRELVTKLYPLTMIDSTLHDLRQVITDRWVPHLAHINVTKSLQENIIFLQWLDLQNGVYKRDDDGTCQLRCIHLTTPWKGPRSTVGVTSIQHGYIPKHAFSSKSDALEYKGNDWVPIPQHYYNCNKNNQNNVEKALDSGMSDDSDASDESDSELEVNTTRTRKQGGRGGGGDGINSTTMQPQQSSSVETFCPPELSKQFFGTQKLVPYSTRQQVFRRLLTITMLTALAATASPQPDRDILWVASWGLLGLQRLHSLRGSSRCIFVGQHKACGGFGGSNPQQQPSQVSPSTPRGGLLLSCWGAI